MFSFGLKFTRNFIPDSFQIEAINYLREGFDVIVSAPTGSGKTYIAEERIRDFLIMGKKVWYATPLKALSNDKYRDFKGMFGDVGILTGDRKENPQASIIVGTTEILRNQLISSDHSDNHPHFIVLDEAHWIGDEERGVSWEEVIIFSSPQSQLLLLSATFPNVDEIARWISEVRGKEVKVVLSYVRPVPLEWYSLSVEGLKPLFEDGKVLPNEGEFDLSFAVRYLQKKNLLPAIFFVGSRVQAEELSLSLKFKDGREKERIEFLKPYFEKYDYIKHNLFIENFVLKGVAPHHGGILPILKVIFEDAMKIGIMNVIFATKTLASGIDVPARTVLLLDRKSFDGKRISYLSPTELKQMVGRAGRRGKDEKGYVIFASPVLPREIAVFGEMKKIKSSFYVNPHLVLSLLKSFDLESSLLIAKKSLKSFEEREEILKWERKYDEIKGKMNEIKNEIRSFAISKICSPETRKRFELGRINYPCGDCPNYSICGEKSDVFFELSKILSKIGMRNPDSVGKEFYSMAQFLRDFGFLDKDYYLTEEGWELMNIRHPRSVYIYLFLKEKDYLPYHLPCYLAVLLSDPKPPFEPGPKRLERFIEKLYNIEIRYKLTPKFKPEFLKRRVVFTDGRFFRAMKFWIEGRKIEDVASASGVQEGDFARQVIQVVELLRQLTDIKKWKNIAEESINLIFRSPISDFVE